jgi:hypothetical protein
MTVPELEVIITNLRSKPDFNVSPFGLHKMVNSLLKVNLPPQMFYNYVGKKYIKATKVNGKWQIAKVDAIAFIERYAFRNLVTIESK